MKSLFIVLEGPDGVGKSSLQRSLAAKITNLVGEKHVVCSRQPYRYRDEIKSTSFHNWVRMLFLFMKDREVHWEEVLKPALDSGSIILLDRYILSTMVYQGLFGVFCYRDLWWGHEGFSQKPDVTFLLDAPSKMLAERMASRGIELLEVENGDYLPLVRLQYLKFVKQADLGVFPIDASGDPQEATDQAWEHLRPLVEDWRNAH